MNQMLPMGKVSGIFSLMDLLAYCGLYKKTVKNRYCFPKQLDRILLASFLSEHQMLEYFELFLAL